MKVKEILKLISGTVELTYTETQQDKERKVKTRTKHKYYTVEELCNTEYIHWELQKINIDYKVPAGLRHNFYLQPILELHIIQN